MSAFDAYPKRPPKASAAMATIATTEGSTSSCQPSGSATANLEDFKTDIPYFDDTHTPDNDPIKQQHFPSAWSPDYERDTPEPGEQQGDNDLDLDDSYTDSNYVTGRSAANSYYQSPTLHNSDLMLRPPSNSVFQYSYPSSTPGPGPGSGFGIVSNSDASGDSRRLPAAFLHSQTLSPPPSSPSTSSSSFYPNMWYPNASYGAIGGHAYGSCGAFGVVPSAIAGPYAATAAAHGMLYQQGHHPHSQLYHQHPNPNQHYQHHLHPHETMMEMFQLSNSGREARNRAEKNRRDKLNGSIQELSTMVPHVAESPRRVDKTAVLRFAAHGLRLKHVFGRMLHEHRPQLTDTLMGMLDSFFLTLTCHGQILLISSSIEQHLGHCQTDLYGQSILHITHSEDHEMLKQQLIPNELENLFDAHEEPTDMDANADVEGETRHRSKCEEDYIDRKLRADKRSFRVRLARAGPRSEPTAYEVVKIDGCFRRSDEAPKGVRSNMFTSNLQLIRRTRGRDDAIPLHTMSGNDIVLTACARIIRPPKIVNRLFDANTLEYRTRHLIDGRIIDCDQRIGIVAGYMTDEVRNLNPFSFMHNDDVRWVIVALRQMYDCNSSYGESTYRLFTRNGNIIYLQSKGFLEIDKETNKVHSFVCVNTLLDDEEGKRRVQEMKKKFSVIINTQIPQSTIDVPASEHPAQLEKAVLCLIQNLQNSVSDIDTDQKDADEGDEDEDVEGSFGQFSQMSLRQLNDYHQSQHDKSRSRHNYLESPMSQARQSAAHGSLPLALVPPETASVKSSISKSVSVVNVTAAKYLRGMHHSATSVKSPSSMPTSTLLDSCTCHPGDMDCDYCHCPLTPKTCPQMSSSSSNLKRSSSSSVPHNAQDDVNIAKRRFMPSTEIEHALSNSLEEIERNLHQQLNVAAQLRDQGNRYELPHANQRIDEIMEEHQRQSELYVNIKSEYEEQLHNKKLTVRGDTQQTGSQVTTARDGGVIEGNQVERLSPH